MLKRARQISSSTLVSVVLPKSEFESWFLGSIESLRGVRGIADTASPPPDAEALRDAKGRLTNMFTSFTDDFVLRMEGRRVYVEVDDQPAFAATFDFKLAFSNCRSFRKFQSPSHQVGGIKPSVLPPNPDEEGIEAIIKNIPSSALSNKS